MRATILSARRAAARAAAGDRHAAGQVFAYHDVLSVLKEQAQLVGVRFDDAMVAGSDPDELIHTSAPLESPA